MDKNFTEVTIAGKTYTLGGYEDEEYLQRIAGYLNAKINGLKKTEGFNRFNDDYKALMLDLNIADDLFKARKLISELEADKETLEKEVYNLKHELVANKVRYGSNR